MRITKRGIILDAYGEAGLAHYAFDLTPEQVQSALRKLNGLMGEWDTTGIRIGFPFPSSYHDVEDIDAPFTVPDYAFNAVILALSVRIAPQYGKVVSPETMKAAKESFDALTHSVTSNIPQMQYMEGTPSGNNNGYTRRTFMPSPRDNIDAGTDSELEFTP